MTDTRANGVAFELVRRLVRFVPAEIRGKAWLSRWASRPFFGRQLVCIPDRFGNAIWCPSLQEPIAIALFADGAYESDTIQRIVSALPPDGTYLDVGANVGTIALAVAALRPDANIVCIEGLPELAEILRRNVRENARGNVTVVETLAGSDDRAGVAFYRAPAAKFGMGSVGPQFGAEPLALPQRRLDAVLDELGCERVDAVKIDIEGAELQALRGLYERLRSPRPPVIVFEFADWSESRISGQAPGDSQRFLLSLGYALACLGRRGAADIPLPAPLVRGAAMLVATPVAPFR